jgi:hypothetical protein
MHMQGASLNRAILQHWGGCRSRHFAVNLKALLVAMKPWTGAQRAFAVKEFRKTAGSLVIA